MPSSTQMLAKSGTVQENIVSTTGHEDRAADGARDHRVGCGEEAVHHKEDRDAAERVGGKGQDELVLVEQPALLEWGQHGRSASVGHLEKRGTTPALSATPSFLGSKARPLSRRRT